MGDLLSSASLLFTLIGLLYSVWYAEIQRSLEVKVKPHALDRVPDHRLVRNTFRAKLLPVTIAALCLTAVFAPNAIRIVVDSIRQFRDAGIAAVTNYDAVAASIVLVVLGAVFLTVHLIGMCLKIRTLLKQLGSNT